MKTDDQYVEADSQHTKGQSRAGGPDAEIERTIIATNAGHIAHGVCYEAAANGDANAADDFELIQALLREMYSVHALRHSAQWKLLRRAKELVAQYWGAITDIAEALWAIEWIPTKQGAEKHLEGKDVLAILGRWQIEVVLVEGN